MEVYIPTLGRRNVQETWNNLPEEVRQRTKFAVDASEADQFQGLPITVLPEGCRGIGKVRQHLIDITEHSCLMLDDDLRFAIRRADEPSKFADITNPDTLTAAIDSIAYWLDHGYPLVGMATREGGNRDINMWIENTRILRVLGYRADILRQEGIRFDRIHVMEDFDVALQLLERGYPNLKMNSIVHDQRGSNLAGGCSTYRTMRVQAEAAVTLHSYHPHVVSVVQKETKTAWGGGIRTDVRIQWKQAFRQDLFELRKNQ